MEVLQHEHPLTLIDLNPEYPHNEVVYDDEDELIMKQAFRYRCRRCCQEINFYHRFYYTCHQCDYSLHKLCAELPTTLRHESDRDHDLILCQVSEDKWRMCQVCTRKHDYEYLNYCCIQCDIFIGLECAKNGVQNHIIYHPSHQHPIMSIPKDILANCDACGNEHRGNFYHCTTCFRFFAHKTCVYLPKKLLIQHHTNDNFNHAHPLTLAYSFPKDDQKAKFFPKCKVCEMQFDENLWLFKCERCRCYVHTNCATMSNEASLNSIGLSQGTSVVSNYIYSIENYPFFVHLPFSDETSQTKVLKHLFYGESGSRAFETNLTHPLHQHPLTLVDAPCCNNDITSTSTSSRITTASGQVSMKMVGVLCNACIRPVTNMPFYKCTSSHDGCNFVIHVWCTRLPAQVMKTGLNHEKITLEQLPQLPNALGMFQCSYCEQRCNGFGYYCEDPRRITDVYCGVTPEYITHKSHPKHILRKTVHGRFEDMYCRLCLSDAKKQLFYSCLTCKFHIHTECALLWSETIRHKYDKHPMTLRYFPVENYNGDYFCEVCEEEFNPNGAFYHCDHCVQSMHPACCVSVLQREPTPFYLDRRDDQHDNIKYGGIIIVKFHGHPLSFLQGTKSDGDCDVCGVKKLQGEDILKCFQCEIASCILCFNTLLGKGDLPR